MTKLFFKYSTVLIILCGNYLFAQRSLHITYSVSRTDFFLTLSDSTKLDCTKFVPETKKPKKGFPCLLYLHGYADSKETILADAFNQAQFGYYIFVYSMRGQGNSGGLSNLISTTEMNDLMQVVEFIKKDTSANPDRIGIFGASQGGILPFMAACNGLNVRCILADLSSPEFASSWIENGCVKITLFFSVDYDSTLVRYDNNIKNIRRWILSKNNDKWDSLAYFLPQDRDFMEKVNQCSVPILLTNAWQDKFFNTSGVIKASSKLTVPYALYMGAVNGHGADSSYRESSFISKFDNAWIEYWLNDISNGVLDSNKFNYASSHYPVFLHRWSFSHFNSPEWFPDNMTSLRLYFHSNDALKKYEATGNDSVSFINDVRDQNLTMQQAIDAAFKGIAFNLRFVKKSISFVTDTLEQDYHVVGAPRINLNYSSTADVCQYNFQIWEVKPTNQTNFVARINFTDRHYSSNTTREQSIDGIAFSHIFKQGDRIRIVVTNLDTQPADSFLTTHPHVLPILKRAENKIFMSASRQTYIELPLKDYSPNVFVNPIPIAADNYLDQNYPNPISSHTVQSTTIRYRIIKDENIMLQVFDLFGREIQKLVNSHLQSGEHEITINTSFLPGGIYFYRLTTKFFTQTRAMVVTR